MKHILSSVRWTALFVLAGVLSGAPADNKQPKKTADPFLSGAPFTLEQVQRLLNQDAIPLRRRKDAIQSRGVDFSISPETLDQLKKAGATTEILELIEGKAKPAAAVVAVPQPVKHHAMGGLVATCAPAECVVSVNGTPRGSTDGGVMELAGLTPGNWTVDFSKDGYLGHQAVVMVEADKKTATSAVLAPNRATEEAFGAALFKKMIEALGGEDGLSQITAVQATGSAMILRNGNTVRWSLVMRNRPDRALFQARAGAVLYEVVFMGNEFTASKNLKGQDAMELPTNLGFIRDYQLVTLITRLKDARYKFVAKQVQAGDQEQFSLFAEAPTEKIAIGLDSELRPQRVRITTETGVASATVTFADYFKNGIVSYPKTIQIKPEGRDRGVEVRFDNVELNTTLKDNDYKLRGKPLATLANQP